MTFQEHLLNIQKRVEGNMPPAYTKIMHTATRNLQASGIQDRVLKVSENLPDFELINQDNQRVKSEDLLSQGPLVITFYRGVWCPYCNADLTNLEKYAPAIREAGATLIAISPEQSKFLKKVISRHRLNFDILHDKDNQLAAQFGLKYNLPDDLKELYRDKLNVNLKLHQHNDEWALPMPARFVINPDGMIKYAESAPDYRTRPDADDLMKILNNI